MTMDKTMDAYYSQEAVDCLGDGTVAVYRRGKTFIRVTEVTTVGKKPVSLWDDLKSVGRVNISGIVKGSEPSMSRAALPTK